MFFWFCLKLLLATGRSIVFLCLLAIVVIYMGFEFFIEIVVIRVCVFFFLRFGCVFAWVSRACHRNRCYDVGIFGFQQTLLTVDLSR